MTNLYSRIVLDTYDAGEPAPLPENLIGLADESLADLSEALDPTPAEFDGIGFWPAVEADVDTPELDGEGQRYLIPFPPVPEPIFSMTSPSLYAAAQLSIADGEISGIGINSRFAGAFILGTGQYYVMFYDPMPDTEYMAMPTAIGPCSAYVFPSDKMTDGFTITVTNSAGEPSDVEAVNISIVRA